MTRLRPVLTAILGLLLLVQGFAVASANGGVTAADEAPMQAHMPCHDDGGGASQDKPACCDHDCPDMTTCALGHLAVTSAPALAIVPVQPPRLSPRMPSPLTVVPPSLLRPPIDLHV